MELLVTLADVLVGQGVFTSVEGFMKGPGQTWRPASVHTRLRFYAKVAEKWGGSSQGRSQEECCKVKLPQPACALIGRSEEIDD